MFDDKKSAYQDIVVLNSAFAFLVAGKVENVLDGINLARNSLENGLAKTVLEKLRRT